MELNEYIFERIDDYLDGKMANEKKSAFEKEMAEKPDLKEAVDMLRFERQFQKHLVAKDLRSQIDDWEKNPLPKDPLPSPPATKNKWLWALLALGLIAAILYFLTIPGSPAPPPLPDPTISTDRPVAGDETTPQEETDPSKKQEEELVDNKNERPKPTEQKSDPPSSKVNYLAFNQYILNDPQPTPTIFENYESRNGSGSGTDAVDKAITAYKEGRFEETIQLLEAINQSDGRYGTASEILAFAYFEDGQFEKAAPMFKQMYENRKLYRDEPQWYWLRSLMAIYPKDQPTADSLLEVVLQKGKPPYKNKASAMKSELEKARANQ